MVVAVCGTGGAAATPNNVTVATLTLQRANAAAKRKIVMITKRSLRFQACPAKGTVSFDSLAVSKSKMENVRIELTTSCMLSTRSTN